MRAPGMTWFRLPLFIWSLYSTSLILVLATPVLAITLLAISVERIWGVGIFDPNLGGDPVLFQHMFWFYSHPAVYIMILPGMGVVSELITCFSRKRIFGYHFVAFSSMAIAVIGFLVWGHHMFVSGQSIYAGHGIFDPEFHRRRALGDQGLQLDRDALQGLDLVRHADALCPRIHRAVHHRRADRALPRGAGGGCAICTTLISSSRISITSWSAEW